VILAGRRINDSMGEWLAAQIHERLGGARRVLVLGLTFKENVPDLRNSKVVDLVRALASRGHAVDVHDPQADATEARSAYGIALLADLDAARGYDAIVGAVAHDVYAAMDGAALARLLAADGLVADVKGMWRRVALPAGLRRWAP
jgi:UDP-N-acetyl-D-galactosamine dehydrogenase